MYEEEIKFLNRVENNNKAPMDERRKWITEEVSQIKKRFPDIPNDYITYLQEIGTGSFRECQFGVHGLLETIDEIVGEGLYDIKDNLFLIFGHNYSGDFSGFIADKGWKVAELWHETGELYVTDQTFQQYIREQMLMDSSGNDLRIK